MGGLFAQDALFLQKQTSRAVDDLFADIQIRLVDRSTSEDIYHEPVGGRQFLEAITIGAHIHINPIEKLLEKYGLDSPVDGVVLFAYQDWLDLGIEPTTETLVGSKFTFMDRIFQVDVVKPSGFISGSAEYCQIACACHIPHSQ